MEMQFKPKDPFPQDINSIIVTEKFKEKNE